MLSQILMQRTVPSRSGAPPPPPSPDHHDTASIVLALRTLGSFDFEGTGESEEVDECSVIYRNNPFKTRMHFLPRVEYNYMISLTLGRVYEG